MTILVVDDEVVHADIIKEFLELNNRFACTAYDISTARKVLLNIQISFLIVDYKINGTSGLKLINEFPDIPSILLSAIPLRAIVDEKIPENCRYLEKPYRLDYLLKLIGIA